MKTEQKKYNTLWEREWKIIHKIGPSVRSRNRILLRLFKKYIQNGSVLDSGCGDGTFLELLNREYGEKLEYDASDFSDAALKLTRELSFLRKTYLTDLEDETSFPKMKYDAVISSEVLEHINNWELALKNLLNLVKANGFIFITVPHGMKYFGTNDEFANHYRRFEIGQIENELKGLGFEIKESTCWGFPTYWLYYTIILNNTRPQENMSAKHITLKKIISTFLYLIFHIDDLFNNNLGRRLFIVAQKK